MIDTRRNETMILLALVALLSLALIGVISAMIMSLLVLRVLYVVVRRPMASGEPAPSGNLQQSHFKEV